MLVALDELTIAKFSGDPTTFKAKLRDLGDLMAQTSILADLLGRKKLFEEIEERTSKRAFARKIGDLFRTEEPPPPLPKDPAAGFPGNPEEITPVAHVPFEEAISDLLERTPELAFGFREVQRVFTQERAFALALSVDRVLTDRIQIALARLVSEGATQLGAENEILRLSEEHEAGFTRGYVETVYRTNLNTAFTAGRMRQARDPAVRAVVPGFRYDAVGDADTRPNHRALDGMVALQDDPVWEECSPPLGYNCRCTLALATRAEVEAAGVLRDGKRFAVRKPAAGGPDEGFVKVGRTDAQVYPSGPPINL